MNQDRKKEEIKYTVCRNPATGEILGYSPLTDLQELEQIISRAKIAQKSWSKLDVRERVRYMIRVRLFPRTMAKPGWMP